MEAVHSGSINAKAYSFIMKSLSRMTLALISTCSVNRLELLLAFADSEHSGSQIENINYILITALNATRFLPKSTKYEENSSH